MKLSILLLGIGSIQVAAAPYDDNFARNKMYPLCAGLLRDTTQECITTAYPDGVLKRKIVVRCDITNEDNCTAMTLYSEAEQSIIVAFRGAHGNIQDIMNIIEGMLPRLSWPSGGTVAEYVHNAFFRLWNGGIKDDFLSLANRYPNYHLYVTGHSLGGALAPLCATYIAKLGLFPINQITLLTFGEPRIGDPEFAASVDSLLPGTYRVVHYKDNVPHLPSQTKGYQHHKAEVYYLEDMGIGANYTVCADQDESNLCSNGNAANNQTYDHLTYFNVDIHVLEQNYCNYTLAALATTPSQP